MFLKPSLTLFNQRTTMYPDGEGPGQNRFSLGFILSSIGIVWNEGIVNNIALKSLAEYFVTLFEYLSGFNVPRLKK